MSIRPSAGSRAAPPRGEPSGRSGRNLGLALVVIATAQLMVVLDAVLGYSALRAGVASLPFAGTMVVASGVASRLRTRTGTRPPLLAGAAVAAGGMYWFSQVSVRTTYLSGLLGPSLVTAAGLGLLFVPLSLLALDRVRAEDSGLAAGLLNVGQQVGGAIGLAALGTVAWTAVASSARAQLTAAARSGRSLASAQVPVAIYHDALAMGIARGFRAASGSRWPRPSPRWSPSGSGARTSPTPRRRARAAGTGPARHGRAQPRGRPGHRISRHRGATSPGRSASMSTQHRANATPVRIHADHVAEKRLGDWTTARAFEVHARHAQVTIDLRSRQIPDGEVRVQSGGIARLSAIASRAYLADARRAHAEGGTPTMDDPARGA